MSEHPQPRVYTVEEPDLGLEGWLVVDSIHGGMAFGGTRFSLDVSLEEVRDLAQCMSWKLAVHGSPIGGAKAGLRCDPADPRLPELLQAFGEALEAPLRSHVLIGKDLGATNEMLDAIYGSIGISQMHIVQSRPHGEGTPDRLRDLGGYRRHMTGLGISWAVQAHAGDSLAGQRVCIQGFGAVGAGAAVRLSALGAQIVGVSDAQGTVARSSGLGVSELLRAQGEGGRIDREALGEHRAGECDALFAVDADLLVLGATSHSVGAAQAEQIVAPLVVEGANFGLTEDARVLLHERGIVVIPDVLANSSSAAMVALQMATGNGLSDEALWDGIEGSIKGAVRRTMRGAGLEDCTLRKAWIRSIS
jgi:glutamate dehydrogenase (NAD(P)+)